MEKFFSAVVDQQACQKNQKIAEGDFFDFFWQACWSTTTKKKLTQFFQFLLQAKNSAKKILFFGGRILQEISQVQNLRFFMSQVQCLANDFFILLRPYGFENPLTIWFNFFWGGEGQQQEEQHVQEQEQEQDNTNSKKSYIHIQNI